MKRLVCVVEGKGEVAALANLCSRVCSTLGVSDWIVDEQPVRQPRAELVDQGQTSPSRPPRQDSFMKAVELAFRRPADAVLVVCDSDDDCPAVWGPQATQLVQNRGAGGAVMVVREYEAWLLASRLRSDKVGKRHIDSVRDAKGCLRQIIPGYKPTVHQLALTRQINVVDLCPLAPSFRKFVRSLAQIFGARCPEYALDGEGEPPAE